MSKVLTVTNYLQVIEPHKKCVAMKSVLTATFLDKPKVSYHCKYCYKKMRKPKAK